MFVTAVRYLLLCSAFFMIFRHSFYYRVKYLELNKQLTILDVKVIVIILIMMLVFKLFIGCLGLGLLFVRLFLLVLLDHHEAILTLIRCFIFVLSGKQLVSRAELDAILLEAIVECFHRFVLRVVS